SSFLLLSFSIILPYLIVDLKLCNRTDERILELKDEILESFSDSDKYKQMIRQLLSEEVAE
ncbi:hypothetical protein ACNND5_09175, partial [Aerococcus urinaeequi]